MPDIVLADVFMPGRNGYEVCAEIKSDPLLAGIPVVLMVGSFEPFDSSESARVKCDAFITKPFDTTELAQIVHSLIGRAHGSQSSADPSPMAHQHKIFSSEAFTGKRLVTPRTRESFLGAGRILDLFDSPIAAPSETASALAAVAAGQDALVPPAPVSAGAAWAAASSREAENVRPNAMSLSEQALDSIVEKVVRRMSREVVREIAWEVIPELSETLVRQYLQERGVPRNIEPCPPAG